MTCCHGIHILVGGKQKEADTLYKQNTYQVMSAMQRNGIW